MCIEMFTNNVHRYWYYNVCSVSHQHTYLSPFCQQCADVARHGTLCMRTRISQTCSQVNPRQKMYLYYQLHKGFKTYLYYKRPNVMILKREISIFWRIWIIFTEDFKHFLKLTVGEGKPKEKRHVYYQLHISLYFFIIKIKICYFFKHNCSQSHLIMKTKKNTKVD